ncbi:hypothetical protein [Streptomyces sp. NPDC002187]|uniref:hypothetical protein n=1 Tax=Streptomyces sp. NPDC002187 TaxID=3364637 RepID=UPI0036B261BA
MNTEVQTEVSTATPHPSDQRVPAAPADYCSLVSVKPLRMVAVIGGLPTRREEAGGRIRLANGDQAGFIPTAALRRVPAKCGEGEVHS